MCSHVGTKAKICINSSVFSILFTFSYFEGHISFPLLLDFSSLLTTRLVSSTLAGYFANYATSVECDNQMHYLENALECDNLLHYLESSLECDNLFHYLEKAQSEFIVLTAEFCRC